MKIELLNEYKSVLTLGFGPEYTVFNAKDSLHILVGAQKIALDTKKFPWLEMLSQSSLSVDETLMCSFQILKPAEKKQRFSHQGGGAQGRPGTPGGAGK